MDKGLLQQMVIEKFVMVQKHPDADLFIYNYANKAQYEKVWNEVTLQSRGLILDGNLNLVARPFKKFFNLEEYPAQQIPDEPFDVYEKLDGSLGILYWINNVPYIATRGSFISDQALHATKILHNKYSHTFNKLDRGITYLFEIIYPENRIVVDYGIKDDLILLAAIDTLTGDDVPLPDLGFVIVKKYNGIEDLNKLKALEEENKEGFVVKFKSGLRLKVKFSEYLRLHKIVTGVSNVDIWEHLSEGRPFDELVDRVPDEFFDWISKIKNDLTAQYDAIVAESENIFNGLDHDSYPNRKALAEYFKTQRYPAILFAMFDGKPYAPIIWKLLKPQYAKPYKIER